MGWSEISGWRLLACFSVSLCAFALLDFRGDMEKCSRHRIHVHAPAIFTHTHTPVVTSILLWPSGDSEYWRSFYLQSVWVSLLLTWPSVQSWCTLKTKAMRTSKYTHKLVLQHGVMSNVSRKSGQKSWEALVSAGSLNKLWWKAEIKSGHQRAIKRSVCRCLNLLYGLRVCAWLWP